MEDSDNIMNILKSITPIKYTYSKRKKAIDNSFKHMSLQRLIKNMNYHPKIIDEFAPAPEFLKKGNKYNINFKKSNAYIKELSDLSKLPIINNKKNLDNKKIDEKEKRKKERLSERYKRLYFFKKKNSSVDSLIYNPNYDYIKKKIYCVHIKPPPPIVTIKKHNKDKENEIYIDTKKKNSSKEKNKDEKNITEQQTLEKEQNKSQGDIELNSNNKQNNSIVLNTNNQNNNNSSIVNNESCSNNSNSSKNHYKYNNSKRNSTRNSLKSNQKLINLKSLSNKNNEKRYSLPNSDCYTLEVNKSTNIEDISHIYPDKEKIQSSNSMRNIYNKNIKFPKINNIKKSALKKRYKRNNRFKNYVSFKKMRGRDDDKSEEKDEHLIAYEPNYEFFRPHIHSTFFSYKNSDENYKKFKTGKIIRGYNYSPDDYFVCEFEKKKSSMFNINKEKLKIIELLKQKVE